MTPPRADASISPYGQPQSPRLCIFPTFVLYSAWRINSKSIKEGFLMPEKLITYTQKIYRLPHGRRPPRPCQTGGAAALCPAGCYRPRRGRRAGRCPVPQDPHRLCAGQAGPARHTAACVDEELTLVTQPERCKRAVNKRITHFYDPTGQRSPQWTAAGYSLIPKSV